MKILKTAIVLALLTTPASPSFAAQTQQEASIISVSGKAEVKFARDNKWVEASISAVLREGDIVRTKNNSSVMISVRDGANGSMIDLSENSQLMFLEFTQDDRLGTRNTILDLSLGEVAIKSKNSDNAKNKFEVKTPTSMVGVQKGDAFFTVKVEHE
jgi:hypothetical protein